MNWPLLAAGNNDIIRVCCYIYLQHFAKPTTMEAVQWWTILASKCLGLSGPSQRRAKDKRAAYKSIEICDHNLVSVFCINEGDFRCDVYYTPPWKEEHVALSKNN